MADRTDTARDHDDSTIIDSATDAPDGAGRNGGNLQRDIGTQAELDRVRDPEATERVTKEDDIANNDVRPSDRPRG